MAASPFLLRNLAGVVLIICATVTLGISVHVENSIRQFNTKTSTFTYDAFVGAFTLATELIFLGLRLGLPSSKVVSFWAEGANSALLWVFWLAAGISTTIFTSEDRSVCKHVDDLFDLPEFENVDKEILAAAKKIFKSACSEIHAELAFIWINWILATVILGYVVYLWFSAGHNKTVMNASFKTYRKHLDDPFRDPQGLERGPTAGFVDPNERIETVGR